jgi:glucuronoarabinoxylan endo-1,4-beta-xylanase
VHLLLSLLTAVLICVASLAAAQTVVHIHPRDQMQTMEGFGAGIDGNKVPAMFGLLNRADRQHAYDLVYGESGAQLNIVRLTISPYAASRGDGHFRWDQDAYTQAELATLKDLPSHPSIYAVPFTPPAMWKSNHKVKGGGILVPAHYQDYASYLVDFIDYMQSQHFEIEVLSVQNEPGMASPWLACTFTPQEMHDFLAILGPAVRSGGHRTRIMLSEGTNWTGAWDHVLPALADPRTRPYTNVLASHSYPPNPPNPAAQDQARRHFAAASVQNRVPVWMSEMSLMIPPQPDDPGMTAALKIANYLYRDISLGRASAWIYCFAIFTHQFQGSMGVLAPPDADPAHPQLSVPKRLWAIAHYSRFVRPGWRRVAVDGDSVSIAFIDPEGRRFAVVATNDSDHELDFSYEFDEKAIGNLEEYVTSAALNLSAGPTPPPVGRVFRARLSPRSITTFTGTLSGANGPAANNAP